MHECPESENGCGEMREGDVVLVAFTVGIREREFDDPTAVLKPTGLRFHMKADEFSQFKERNVYLVDKTP